MLIFSLMDYQVEMKVVTIIIENLLYCLSIAVIVFVMSHGCPVGTRKQVVD
jgi:hypothetical protein